MRLRDKAKTDWQERNEQRTILVEMSLYRDNWTRSKKRIDDLNKSRAKKKKLLETKLDCRLIETFNSHFGLAFELHDRFEDDAILLCVLFKKSSASKKSWHLIALNDCSDKRCRNKHVGTEIKSQADIHQAILDNGRYQCIGLH